MKDLSKIENKAITPGQDKSQPGKPSKEAPKKQKGKKIAEENKE
jgi:hypothetical protein